MIGTHISTREQQGHGTVYEVRVAGTVSEGIPILEIWPVVPSGWRLTVAGRGLAGAGPMVFLRLEEAFYAAKFELNRLVMVADAIRRLTT